MVRDVWNNSTLFLPDIFDFQLQLQCLNAMKKSQKKNKNLNEIE